MTDADHGLTIGEYDLDDAMIARTREDRVAHVTVYDIAEPFIVLGKGSRVDRELQVATCLDDDAVIVRRHGGGCAVVLDEGNLVISVALPTEGLGGNQRRFRELSQIVITALDRSGVPDVKMAGTSDLVIGDRKISGSAIHQQKDVVYYTATLLVAPDFDRMDRWLAHPPREPEYRGGRSHSEFCTAIGPLVGREKPVATLADRLRQFLRVESVAAVG